MVDLDKTLFEAEEALKRAEEVRLVALHAVDKAREAIKLKAAGVAAEKLLHAAEIAAAQLGQQRSRRLKHGKPPLLALSSAL